MRKVLVRDNGGRVYFSMFRVLESGLSDSIVSYANGYCDGERREGDCKENKRRKNNRKHDMQEGDRGKVTVEKEGGGGKGTGDDRSRCDSRKEVRVDVTKLKSITRMMTGRKEAGKKQQRLWQGEKSATREMQNGAATLKQ